ncbi:MAG: STT3 domain-containing protein [Candidatus Aenigmatarchaeota archaeon]
MEFRLEKIFNFFVVLFSLLLIIYLAVYARLSTLSAQTILDYDPWWYYRHALEIIKNNYLPLAWDLQSYYPPGRPYEFQLGFEYTMILFYKIAQFFFGNISFMFIAKISPLIMVALGAIVAFLLGKFLTNNWGGLATALFAVLTPTFIGVSMAGYCDNDPVVVFYTFLCTFSVFLALKKKSIPYYLLAIVSNLLFVFNWGGGWFVLILLTTCLFFLFFFRILEEIIHQRRFLIEIEKPIQEIKSLLIPYLIILIPTNIISFFLGWENIFSAFLVMIGFMDPSRGLLVNISVAELQRTVSILDFLKIIVLGYVPLFIIPFFLFKLQSKPKLDFGEILLQVFLGLFCFFSLYIILNGLLEVVGRIGYAPFLFSLFIIPLISIKFYNKLKLDFTEIFLILWYFATLFMISSGVRFALSFSVSTAASAGYVIGNLVKYLKRDFIASTVFGAIITLSLIFISTAIQVGYASVGMEISQNWINAMNWLVDNVDKDSLIVTWWDPGHIIAGYSYDKGKPLKVHADGAHCGPPSCIPYNHNIRIQDMGRIFSTSSEEEAVSILKKYKELSFEDCEKVKKTLGDIVPKDACNPVSDMYVIASADLIGKYVWVNFFGGFRATENSPGACKVEAANTYVWCFWQSLIYRPDYYQNPTYFYGAVTLLPPEGKTFDQCLREGNCSIYPIWENRYLIEEVYYPTYFGYKYVSYANQTNVQLINGLLWVDSGYSYVIFMPPAVRDSLFTRMFFWNGQGLKHFEYVYGNAELKIFKVIF